jgi:hypothetical protein
LRVDAQVRVQVPDASKVVVGWCPTTLEGFTRLSPIYEPTGRPWCLGQDVRLSPSWISPDRYIMGLFVQSYSCDGWSRCEMISIVAPLSGDTVSHYSEKRFSPTAIVSLGSCCSELPAFGSVCSRRTIKKREPLKREQRAAGRYERRKK